MSKQRRRRKDLPGAVRENVMQRDGHRCFFCAMTRLQSQHLYELDLHVHHIKLDGSTENPDNNLENLVVLCTVCHQKLHALFNKYLKNKKT